MLVMLINSERATLLRQVLTKSRERFHPFGWPQLPKPKLGRFYVLLHYALGST